MKILKKLMIMALALTTGILYAPRGGGGGFRGGGFSGGGGGGTSFARTGGGGASFARAGGGGFRGADFAASRGAGISQISSMPRTVTGAGISPRISTGISPRISSGISPQFEGTRGRFAGTGITGTGASLDRARTRLATPGITGAGQFGRTTGVTGLERARGRLGGISGLQTTGVGGARTRLGRTDLSTAELSGLGGKGVSGRGFQGKLAGINRTGNFNVARNSALQGNFRNVANIGQFQRVGRFHDRAFVNKFSRHWNNWWGNNWGWGNWNNWWWGFNWWLSPWFWWGTWWNPWWAWYVNPIPVYDYQTYVTRYVELPVEERQEKFSDLLALVLTKLDELQKGNQSQIEALEAISDQIATLRGQANAARLADKAKQLIDKQEDLSDEIDQLTSQANAIRGQYTGSQQQINQLLQIANAANSLIERQKKQSEEVGRLSNDVFSAQHEAGLVNISGSEGTEEEEETEAESIRSRKPLRSRLLGTEEGEFAPTGSAMEVE